MGKLLTAECSIVENKISILIRNISTKSIEVYEGGLPWRSSVYSQLIFIADTLGDKPIIQPSLVDDPSPGTIVIPAGGQIAGELNLRSRLPAAFDPGVGSSGVLFWLMRVPVSDGKIIRLCGHNEWVVLRK